MDVEIPLTKLWMQAPEEQTLVALALQRVLASGSYILGREVAAFEEEFSAYLGGVGGVGVASGTDAIMLGLLAGGVGAGDEVLVPAFGSGATVSGVLAAGATPVLAEVGWDFGLNLERLSEALTPRTRAVVVVHLFGRMDEMTPMLAFAKAHRLWVVEDCAQSHGARYWSDPLQRWCMAGTLGDVGAFSFYPTKNLGAMGDGGFCCTASPAVLERLRALRQYGWRVRDDSGFVGRNSRLDEVQAAVLRVGLPKLDAWNVRRSALAALYRVGLLGFCSQDIIAPPSDDARRKSVWHLLVVRTHLRERLTGELSRHGIGFGIHYPKALSQQTAYRQFAAGRAFPVAEQLASEVLSLPLFPLLEEASVSEVLGVLADFFSKI